MNDWSSRLITRLANESDVPELRLLVNAAYRELAEMGMNYTGTYQDEEITRSRMSGRDVHVAFLDGKLVATISTDVRDQNGRPTLYIGQFAVAPELKQQGIGGFLMDHVEGVARQRGITRLGLDTATRAHHLVRFYTSLGFRIVDEVHWEGKTYDSYIMEKDLDQGGTGEMNYNFDHIYDRASTDSLKWKKGLFGAEDILPLWVADMDFPVAEPIVAALRKRLEHPIFGYGYTGESITGSIVERLERKWGWHIEPEWIVFSPGVVPLLTAAVRSLVPQGKKVAIQTPGYPRFFPAITTSGCVAAVNQHMLVGDHYEMDFADLEAKFADPDVGAFMLCSPQNPIGRIWRREELLKIGELALRYNKPVISDEMHAEIIMPGFSHVPFGSLSPELENRSMVCMSISKTFNLAGLAASFAIIPDKAMREGVQKATNSITGDISILGIIAMEAAFRCGDEWLEQVLAYIDGNYRFLRDYLATRIPRIKALPMEGTYLAWLDCRELGLDVKALEKFFREQAKVAPMGEAVFGPGSESFQRLNLACPRSILAEALARIERAANNL